MLTSYLPVYADAGWVSIVSPGPGETLAGHRAEVSVSFSTGSDQKVTRVDVDVEGKRYATKNLPDPSTKGIASFLIDTTKFGNGVRSVIVKVYSGTTLIGSASTKCAVSNSPIDVLPPTVKFVGVNKNKVYSGTAEIEVSARDGSDKDPLVSIMVDKSLKLIKNTAPYRYTWNTNEYENGAHVLKAYAYDEAGNRGDTEEIEVQVRNASATVAEAPSAAVTGSTATTNTVAVESTTAVVPVERSATTASAARAAVPSSSGSQVNSASARPDRVAAPAVTTTASAPRNSDRASAAASDVAPKTQESTISRPNWTERVVAKPAESKPTTVRQPEAAVKVSTSASPSTSRLAEPKAPAQAPEKTPIAQTVKSAPGARIDQPVLMAALPEPPLISGPSAEDSQDEPTAPANASTPKISSSHSGNVVSEAAGSISEPASTVEPEVPTEPAIATDAPRVVVANSGIHSDRTEGIRQAQKIARPTLPEPIKVARAPKPEPVKSTAIVDPKQVKVRLQTSAHKGTLITGLRFAIESAGGKIVGWDKKTRTVVAVFANKTVRFRVGEPIAMVNGHQVNLTCAPFITGRGRMMVDIQALKQVLGASIEADEDSGEWRVIPA
jgi:hypothetical protein